MTIPRETVDSLWEQMAYKLYFGPNVVSCSQSLQWIRNEALSFHRGLNHYYSPFILPESV